MNTNPDAKRILCFGDSNVWGRSGASEDRYPKVLRWTALLQQKLGSNYEIIEEGLRSRTTNLEDSKRPGRNGLTYLFPCVESHQPLDLVILWLGTNDFKARYDRSAGEVTEALRELVVVIKTTSKDARGQLTKILLVSPPLVREEFLSTSTQFAGAGEKSKQLAALYEQLASEEQTAFIDIAKYVTAGEFDGVHLEPEMHPIVAEKLYEKIIEEVLV